MEKARRAMRRGSAVASVKLRMLRYFVIDFVIEVAVSAFDDEDL